LQIAATARLALLVRHAPTWFILKKLHQFGAYAWVCIKFVRICSVIDFKGEINLHQNIHYLFAHGKMLA
jgi:hypothetical protein